MMMMMLTYVTLTVKQCFHLQSPISIRGVLYRCVAARCGDSRVPSPAPNPMWHYKYIVVFCILLCLDFNITLTVSLKQSKEVFKASIAIQTVAATATAAALLAIPPQFITGIHTSNAYAASYGSTTTKVQLDSNTVSKNNKNEKVMMPTYDLLSELETYEADTESLLLKQRRQPYSIMSKLEKSFSANKKITAVNNDFGTKLPETLEAQLKDAQERVLTLAAYLDEIERDLFSKNWDNLQVYLYTFAEQENAFAILIDSIFPENTKLDENEREALSAEAKAMFLALDDLREAAKYKQFKAADIAYAKLLLSYDRFLKAGDLYPTYDPITSTEVFFKDTPKDTLRYDSKAKVQVLDKILLTEGPDMGKTGTIINIDGDHEYAIIKLDKDGKAYNEVKYVKLKMLAKTLDK